MIDAKEFIIYYNLLATKYISFVDIDSEIPSFFCCRTTHVEQNDKCLKCN